jgi:AraC-like DNA-binding protein
METDDYVHFGGNWREAEREAVGEAVAASEEEVGRGPPDDDASAPWVCLRVHLNGEPYFLGYRLGGEEILKAQSAAGLATKIESGVDGDPGDAECRGGIPAYRLRKVVDFVRDDPGRRITVAQMAEEAGMSEFHFAREFKRSLGLTPKQYVTQCRVEESGRLLRSTDLKIEEVARRCGYQSASHFAEVFQKHVGMTPSRYRRRGHA